MLKNVVEKTTILPSLKNQDTKNQGRKWKDELIIKDYPNGQHHFKNELIYARAKR